MNDLIIFRRCGQAMCGNRCRPAIEPIWGHASGEPWPRKRNAFTEKRSQHGRRA
jgi:hypothetical protein